MSPSILRASLTEPAASMSKPKSQIVDSGKIDLTTKVNFHNAFYNLPVIIPEVTYKIV